MKFSLPSLISNTKYILMLLMFSSTLTFAARPYHTDDPGTTELGKFELELSNDYWSNASTPGLVFKHGLTDRMELDIPIGYTLLPSDERAVSPLQLYAKFAIINRSEEEFTKSLYI